MENAFSVSEILRCVEEINPTKKIIHENYHKKLTSDIIKKMEKENVNKINQEKEHDILILTNEAENQTNSKELIKMDLDLAKISKLKKKISELSMRNDQLQIDLNEFSKTISDKIGDKKVGSKELQVKLELIYKQQKIIKDYESQISKLRNQIQLFEQKLKLPSDKLPGSPEVSQTLNQEQYNEELNIKTKVIYDQQSIINDYQKEIAKLKKEKISGVEIEDYLDQILKLKEENQSLKKRIEIINNSDQMIQNRNNEVEVEDMAKKIKFYQDDILRLSNDKVKLSNKLENAKQQLNQFENNKAKLNHQLNNLNKIISENNIIGTPFGGNEVEVENKIETNEKISNEEQKLQNTSKKKVDFRKLEDFKNMNELTKNIFKK